MIKVFPWVAASAVVLLCGAAVLGLIAQDEVSRVQHVALAVFTLLVLCGVHTGVFTYFTVTGKLIQQAVALGSLDTPAIMAEVKELKRRVTRCVATGIVVIVPVVATGAWAMGTPAGGPEASASPVTSPWHLVAGVPLIAVHVWVFMAYHQLIAGNAALLSRTMEAYMRTKEAKGSGREAESERGFELKSE